MIIRCTKRIVQKINEDIENEQLQHLNKVEWYATLFIANRIQYISATETRTLFTILFPGHGISTANILEETIRFKIKNYFIMRGWHKAIDMVLDQSTATIIRLNHDKSLSSTINQMLIIAKDYLFKENENIETIMDQMNSIIFSRINWSSPEKEIERMMKPINQRPEKKTS